MPVFVAGLCVLVVVGGFVGVTSSILIGMLTRSARPDTSAPRRSERNARSPAESPQPGATGSENTPVPENDGTDPLRPILPVEDRGFVDTRGGWGWGDKCWLNIKAGKWGWAKAECDQGMKLNPASPQPRASLLYNEGLIAKAAGDIEGARRNFNDSLALRKHPQVRAALESLPAE